jgi:hypothetical protein
MPGAWGATPASAPPPTAVACTVAAYAKRKGLPVEFLRGVALRDVSYQGSPAIRMPYLREYGTEGAVRFRTALEKSAGDDDRFKWKTGSKLLLYGLERLPGIRQANYVALVEGESDCHTLWFHGVPALGIPGADNWNEQRDAPSLDDIATIYITIEPDRGGEAALRWLAGSAIRDRAHLLMMPAETKDPSSLHTRDLDQFAARWQELLDGATPWAELARAQADAERQAAWEQCRELAQEADIPGRFVRELAADGLAGEARAAKLLYLVITSRLLDQPASAAVKGPSAGGKSFVTESVLRYFPPPACYVLSAMSEHALAYSTEPLSHRMLVLFEAAGMSGEFTSYLIRSLLSEGRVRYETVEKTPFGMQARLIEREGPTGLLVTTTALALHPENETRLVSITITDTVEQTRAVLRAQAQQVVGANADGDDDEREARLALWHALQTWLAATEAQVTIPFALALAGADAHSRTRRLAPGDARGMCAAASLRHSGTMPQSARWSMTCSPKPGKSPFPRPFARPWPPWPGCVLVIRLALLAGWAACLPRMVVLPLPLGLALRQAILLNAVRIALDPLDPVGLCSRAQPVGRHLG